MMFSNIALFVSLFLFFFPLFFFLLSFVLIVTFFFCIVSIFRIICVGFPYCLLIVLLFYRKHKKFTGEIFCMYLAGYGLGRVWIEGLRTDQLVIGNTGIAVSQLLAGVLFVVFTSVIIVKRVMLKKAANGASETVFAEESAVEEEKNAEVEE